MAVMYFNNKKLLYIVIQASFNISLKKTHFLHISHKYFFSQTNCCIF